MLTLRRYKDTSFCNFVFLSFPCMHEKMRGDEVEVGKILIVICINKIRKNLSLANHCFSEFNKKKPLFW